MGYFTEMGIGCRRDVLEANVWYVKAADHGYERAKERLKIIRDAASGITTSPLPETPGGKGTKGKALKKGKDGSDKDCVVM
jgi:TPR repeat protein